MLNVYEIVDEDVLFDEIFWGSFWCFGTDYLSDWLRVYSVLPTLTLNPSQSACSSIYISSSSATTYFAPSKLPP